jgi:hypothetical protein
VSKEEVVVAFDPPRSAAPPATAVRTTVLLSSLRGLRVRSLFTAYMGKLDPRSHESILSISAANWLPITVARDHYAACDALDLSRSAMREIGEESGLLLNQTVLGVILKISTSATGITPWPAIAQSRTLIARTWQGTSIAAFKLGPKEARIEWVGQPCAVSGYFRIAFGGFLNGLLSLFCRKSFVRESLAHCSGTTVGYQCSWV